MRAYADDDGVAGGVHGEQVRFSGLPVGLLPHDGKQRHAHNVEGALAKRAQHFRRRRAV